MVIWPALQARAFALVNIFNCGMDVRSFVRSFVVVVRHTQKLLPIVHAAAGARACPSNGIWRICDFDFWHEKSICNHEIMCFENLYVLHNRLSGHLHEESRLLTFGDFSQQAAVALSLIEYGI